MKRLTTALAATALTAGLLGLAPTASAAPACPSPTQAIDSFTPVDAEIGTKKAVTIDLEVSVIQSCDVEKAVAILTGPDKSYRVALRASEPNEGHVRWAGAVRIDPRDLRNSEAGRWELTYRVVGDEGEQSQAADAQVRRATRISFDAGPEPVRNGKITFSGKLERASWNSHRYSGVGKTVVVRTVEDHEYTDVVEVTSKKDGTYRTTVAFPGTNKYWADFDGGEVSGTSTSRVDRVEAG